MGRRVRLRRHGHRRGPRRSGLDPVRRPRGLARARRTSTATARSRSRSSSGGSSRRSPRAPRRLPPSRVEKAVLRPGFERFIAACRDAGVPFVLCSAGLDVYIHPVLGRLAPALRAHVQVRCNEARCSSEGLVVAFHGDGAHGGCGSCGFCKATVVEELRARGHRVAFVGDGSADRCGARAADAVFARRRPRGVVRRGGDPAPQRSRRSTTSCGSSPRSARRAGRALRRDRSRSAARCAPRRAACRASRSGRRRAPPGRSASRTAVRRRR